MGKTICDICGTAYPDTLEQCPVCGYSRDMGGRMPEDGQMTDTFDYNECDPELSEPEMNYGGPDMAYTVGQPQNQASGQMPPVDGQVPGEEEGPVAPPEHGMFDFDAVNPQDEPEYEDPGDGDYGPEASPLEQGSAEASSLPPLREGYASYEDLGDEDEASYGEIPYLQPGVPGNQPRKQPVFLIVFLVILNVALLSASGFLFFRFLLPGKLNDRAMAAEPSTTAAPTTEQTTEAAIPCTGLSMSSSGRVELNKEGQFWLIHAKAMPEDTTDKILYFSEDENVVTVTEGGRVTAVGEGQTNVVVICGMQQLSCPVTVAYKEITETEPVMTHPIETQAEAAETQAAETEAAETEPAQEKQTEAPETEAPETQAEKKPVDPDIVLKLKKNDILFKGLGLSTTLELDCELSPEDVEWSSSDSSVIAVENGKVTTRNFGAATVTAKYGDQEAKCVVRCAKNG